MRRRPSPSAAILIVVACVLAATFSWYAVAHSSVLQVSVLQPVHDVDGIGVGSQLMVQVRNVGTTRVEPTFWVMWSVFVRSWDAEGGPQILMPGITAVYTIHAPYAQMSIPNGGLYIVKVLDRISGIYFRSDLLRLQLSGRPPILNPGLGFWSRDTQTGVLQPFGWSFESQFGPGDEGSVTSATGSSGARIWLHKSDNGTSPSFVQARQEIQADDILRLRTTLISLCWAQAVNYTPQPSTGYPLAASGVQLNGDGRTASLVLSRTLNTEINFANQTILVARAAIDQPGCILLPFEQLIDSLGGSALSSMTFILFAAAWPNVPGDYIFTVTSLSLG